MPDYAVYGLTLRLPFPCPALPQAADGASPDVVVADGAVPRQLEAPLAEGPAWQAETGRFLYRAGARAGRYLAEGGARVTVQRGQQAEDDLLAFYFLDTVLAALLRQRGLLVLHANAAAVAGGAAAIAGESGAGKTTTLAALLARGCAMLSDDITVLRMGADGRVEALPGAPQYHLCEDAAEGLGRDVAGLPRYAWRRMKAVVRAQDEMAARPVPLRAVFWLRCEDGGALRATRLSGADKFAVLQECVYGPLLAQEHSPVFALFAAAAEQAAVYRVTRPASRWTAPDIAQLVLERSAVSFQRWTDR
jgi:hypothetical protein